MAHYFVADSSSVPIMVEDGQQICTVDGQNYHLVLQDVNNGGVNGNTSLIAYSALTSDNSEQTIYTTHQALIGQQQGQNVYIINTDDLSLQQNTEQIVTPGQMKHNDTNTVRLCPNKATVARPNERQQIQMSSMPENNMKNQTVRNQTQRNTAAMASLEQGTSEKVTQKIAKNRSRLSTPHIPVDNTSPEIKNLGPNNKNVTSTFRLKSSQPPKPSARQPIRPMTASHTPPALHYHNNPPMEFLSERIKKSRLQQKEQDKILQSSRMPPSVGNIATTKQQHAVNQPQAQPQARQRVTMTPTKQVIPANYQLQSPEIITTNLSCRSVETTPEKMEITYANSSPEKVQDPSSPSDADSNSESFAYLQKVIDNPANTIVQQQITGNTVKMLVVLPTGEQRLITFDLPNEDCTVQDLLEQAQIPFNGETVVSLVTDTILNINYIVESEAGTIATMRNDSDTSDRETSSTLENSSNIQGSDDNSNSSNYQNEEPKFIEGKLAVCMHCGISSMDFNRCTRCKKKLPIDVKQIPMDTNTKLKKDTCLASIDNFYKKKADMVSKFDREATPKRGRGGTLHRVSKVKPVKEPECLTLSSDEEDNDDTIKKSKLKNENKQPARPTSPPSDEPDTILEKEPIITNNTFAEAEIKSDSVNRQDDDEGSNLQLQAALHCRTVRIGSYKYVPPCDKVVINNSGLRLAVPLLEDNTQYVNIHVKYTDIVKVLIHFGKSMPVLFFYTNVNCAATIREVLGMQDAKGPYYDPASKDHTHKRITLLPEEMSEEAKTICKIIFPMGYKSDELSAKEANDILLRASPKDGTQMTPIRRQNSTIPCTNNTTNGRQNDKVIQKITVYPPPPVKGGIAINTEDYACLAEDQFLNDVIIDFYLKYLTLEVLSERDQQRTHVFSSYFYKRLTSRHAQATENSTLHTPAAKRHARVQKWTKNVNIFEKDFVIIPINEHAHWFLAIICFPGLVGTVIPPPSPAKDPETKKSKKKKEVKLQSVTIGSTTITQVATTITIDQADDDSERDEAEGDDEEMDMESDDDEETESFAGDGASESHSNKQQGIVKSPCILIFDSLAGASRSRVVATLRDYLYCEHVAKMGKEKIFSKDTIKGACPKVPQQSNFTDCGLYLLQYVEYFFKEPIRNYTLPIKTVKNWFEEIVVTRKREELSNLLIKLMNKKSDKTIITLPILQFPTQNGLLKPKPEGYEKSDVKSPKVEGDKKKSSGDEEKNNAQSSQDSNEMTARTGTTTIYTIVPYVMSSDSGKKETSSVEMVVDVTPKPSSTGSTLAYLKNKRIPRLVQRDTEGQESPVAAKKHKGDSMDSCK